MLTEKEKLIREIRKKQVRKAILMKKAPDSYLAYLKLTHPTYDFPEYENSHRISHIQYFSQQIDKLLRGEKKKKRFIINVPPQNLKSTSITETLPSYALIKNPNLRALLTSYGDDLAQRFGERNKEKIEKYGEELGNVKIKRSKSAKDNWELEGSRGGIVSVPYRGGATGNTADLLVIDDPVKNAKEANSPTVQEDIINEWEMSYKTRLNKDSIVFLIMTRWHENDLAGYLLKEYPDEWELWNISAEAEENDVLGRLPGELLWPEKFDWGIYKSIKDKTPAVWSAMYQGNPTPKAGGMFSKDNYQYYETQGEYFVLYYKNGQIKRYKKSDCRCYQIFDGAMKTNQQNDETCLSTWYVTPQWDILLHEIFLERLEIPDQEKPVMDYWRLYSPVYVGVEDKASGTFIIQKCKRSGVPIKPLEADTDKVTRAETIAVYYKNHKVFHNKAANNLYKAEEQLRAFPKVKHDDFVDTASYMGILTSQLAKLMYQDHKIEDRPSIVNELEFYENLGSLGGDW